MTTHLPCPRIEIAETDAEQRWHVRLVAENGEITFHAENLKTHDSAVNEIRGVARFFGQAGSILWDSPDWPVDGTLLMPHQHVPIVHVDERGA